MEIKSLRNLSFAALTALTLCPGLAHAESDVRGNFTLTKGVHWENAIVPAGQYEFSLKTYGLAEVLTLQNLRGGDPEIIGMIKPVEAETPTNSSKIEIVTVGGERFVTSMELAKSGTLLHFAVPDAATMAAIPTTHAAGIATLASTGR